MNQDKLEVVKKEMAKKKKGDDKSEHWHFKNQWSEMDWNGRI